jgi:hypothetical protein
MKKFVSHAVATLACTVVVGAVATAEQKMVGFSTAAAFLAGKFGYDAAQKFLEKKIK